MILKYAMLFLFTTSVFHPIQPLLNSSDISVFPSSPDFLRRFAIGFLKFSQKAFVIGNPVFVQEKCDVFVGLHKVCMEMFHADLVYISKESLTGVFAEKTAKVLGCNG